MHRKIIFFDIDGTICSHHNNHHGISEKVKESIRKTSEKGHLCFVATGRSLGELQKEIKDFRFDGYVLANGAHLIYKGEDLKVSYFDYELLKKAIYLLKEKNIEYILETKDYCCGDSHCENLIHFFIMVGVQRDKIIHCFDEEDALKHTVKVEIWGRTDEEIKYIKECFKDFYYEVHPDNHSIEVTAKNVTKATGILDVLDLLNIEVQDSICFGDGPNDVGMFETVGHSIAMGNAIDIIKNMADEICLSAKDDGVAYKLNEMFDL